MLVWEVCRYISGERNILDRPERNVPMEDMMCDSLQGLKITYFLLGVGTIFV